jgi:flagellar hook-associated protein 2
LVSKLMAVERQPLTAIDKKEAAYQAKLTAFGSLKGALSTLQTSVQSLASPSKYNTMKAAVADTAIASATTTSIAKPANYQLEVTTLAQAQKIASSVISDPTAALGTGKLTIDFGTYTSVGNTFSVNPTKTATSITIDSAHSSLNAIRDAINSAKVGATASIINDGSGYRLVMTSDSTGADNSIRLLVDEGIGGTNTDTNGLSKLAFDPTAVAGAGKNLEVKAEAMSAAFKLDGISITKSSNTVTDAIQGVTLNLLKTNAGTPTTITVSRDTSGVKSSVDAFVKAYNDLAKTVQDLGGYDAKTKKGGVLLGNPGLRSIQDQLRATIGQQLGIQSSAGVSALSDIGVSFQRDGTLAVDSAKLGKILADPSKNVGALFATMGNTTDDLISYVGASSSTQAGVYPVKVTQMPAHGYVSGDTAAATTIDDNNHSLSLSVDGISIDVTLDNGIYTADDLAIDIQTRINGHASLTAAGKRVTVTRSAGKLTITSASYGGNSKVTITGGNGMTPLFGAATSTAGKDAAGEIGGSTASGSGQLLYGVGGAAGLQLSVDGGSTGDRGSVTYSAGIASRLNSVLQNMLDSDGTLAGYTSGIDSSVKDLGKQRTALETRLTQIEARYRSQFNALDQLVASMQQTSSYLTQQLAALSSSTK